jgi:hypothetical protein
MGTLTRLLLAATAMASLAVGATNAVPTTLVTGSGRVMTGTTASSGTSRPA